MQSQLIIENAPGATSNATAVLAELAATAGRHYRKSTASWLEAAAVILEARAIAGHGGWKLFLSDAHIPARTASRMLDFARTGIQIGHLAVFDAWRDRGADLTIEPGFPGPRSRFGVRESAR